MSAKERYSIRVTDEVIIGYKDALTKLPILFKASALIEEYMKSVIVIANEYEKTGHLDMAITCNGKEVIRLKSQGQQKNLDME